MSDIKVVITGDASGLDKATKQATADLGRVGIAAQKADSSLAKMGTGMAGVGGLAQKAASSIGSLTGSLISGGLITAITVAGVSLFNLGKKLFEVSDAQKRFNDVLDGAKSAYVKAVLEVDKMRDAFEKARNGIIKKETALNLYNSTIGKTIGQTDDLKVAEDNLTANAENYIRFTLLKAAANIALGKAAEAAADAELERIKGAKNVTTSEKSGTLRLNFAALSSLDFKNAFFRKSDDQIVNDKIQKFTDIQKIFRDVYDSLIAKSKEFGFVEQEQTTKTTAAIKGKIAAQKEYLTLVRSGLLPQSEPTGDPKKRTTGTEVKILVTPKIEFLDNPEGAINTDEFLKKLELEAFQKEATDAINETISNIINDTISNVAESIGEALAGGKDVVPRLFDNIIKGIGQQIKELGKYLVKIGLEKLAIDKAIKALGLNPAATIAVGFAAQILGSLLISAAQKKSSSLGSGFASGTTGVQQGGIFNVGERGPERIFLPSGAKVQPNNELNAFSGGGVILQPSIHYEGTGFRIMLNRVDAQMDRNG